MSAKRKDRCTTKGTGEEVIQVGKVKVTRRDTGIFNSGGISIEAPDSELFRNGLMNAFNAEEMKLLQAHCHADPTYPPWTLDRVQALVDGVRDDPAATPDEKSDAAAVAAWIPTLRDLLEHRDRANRELDALAKTGVNVRTLRNLAARIESDMRIATDMGVCLSRLAVRWAEPYALKGREKAMSWRGRVLSVTSQERRILESVLVADEVPLHHLVRYVWDELYNTDHRDKYEQAFKRLNSKITDADLRVHLHVRDDRLIVT